MADADRVSVPIAVHRNQQSESKGETLTIVLARDGGTAAASFTLHIQFSADSFARAQLLALDLAAGLCRLRSDVDMYSARVSTDDETVRLFCGAVGPDGERCIDEPEHLGMHDEGGVEGRVWSEREPTVIRIR